MELVKNHWKQSDAEQFQNYLKTFSKGEEKAKWEQRIANTSLPCLAVPAPEIKRISKEIAKGNYLEFLDLFLWSNLSNTFINGYLICQIQDFSVFTKYLKKYVNKCDNWASTDTLKFKINNKNKNDFFGLAKTFIKSHKPFVRRTGLIICLKLLNYDEFTSQILEISQTFANEEEYYVNMMNAWLICESFIKHRDETLEVLKSKTLNKFTQNKAISKCHDSFRVLKEDKEYLKTLRK